MSNVVDRALCGRVLASLAKAYPRKLSPSKLLANHTADDLRCILHQLADEGFIHLTRSELMSGEVNIATAKITEKGLARIQD